MNILCVFFSYIFFSLSLPLSFFFSFSSSLSFFSPFSSSLFLSLSFLSLNPFAFRILLFLCLFYPSFRWQSYSFSYIYPPAHPSLPHTDAHERTYMPFTSTQTVTKTFTRAHAHPRHISWCQRVKKFEMTQIEWELLPCLSSQTLPRSITSPPPTLAPFSPLPPASVPFICS